MKIAFYIPILNVGGAEKVILNLLKQLTCNSNDSYFLITDKKNSVWIGELDTKVTVLNVDSKNHFFSRLYNMRKVIKENKIDLLVSHLTHSNIHCVLIKLLYPIKLILVEHNITSIYINDIGRFGFVFKFFVRNLFRRSNLIISVSKTTQKDLISNFNIPSTICKVIYNPIDFEVIKIKCQDKLPDSFLEKIKQRKFIVTIARLEIQKNHIFLIESVKDLLISEDIVLVFVGGGSLRRQIDSKIKELDLQDHVILTGYENNPYPYLLNASLLVHPARFEGFGLVLVEALYLSIPVVSMDFEVAYEVLENGQLGSIVHDKESLLIGLDYHLKHGADNIKNNYTEHVYDQYNLEVITNQYYAFFKSTYEQI
ncbi:hypothetical protein FFWV33_07725 [Flavobacterium faecale]|uniref:Glycosyltransferase n=1 Tax=Flavobacterium faecale TaxID=1355330 RepID=A0A2S1LCK2_9FLAO|nr:glycosyltransferase [Flavobacterium faecale]AWG21427.1 hypothetical protein FFWV33_07725 [Flavobacterium faecale]